MKLKIAAALTAILLTAALLTGCAEEPFRLHIIANSDSKEDQSVKLTVRDEILKLVEADMKKVKTKDEAKEYISKNIGIIEKKAQEVLDNNHMPYSAKAYIGRYEFPDRTYGDKTYPAGEYDALRIVLGDGEGKNWWCVMYPPLCLMEVSDAEKKDLEEAKSDAKHVQYVSFFGELFQSIFGGGKK